MKKILILLLLAFPCIVIAQSEAQTIQRFVREASSYEHPGNFAPAVCEVVSKLFIKQLESRSEYFRRVSVKKTNLPSILHNIHSTDSIHSKIDPPKRIEKLEEITHTDIWAVQYNFVPKSFESIKEKGSIASTVMSLLVVSSIDNELKERDFLFIRGNLKAETNITIFVYDSMALKNFEIKEKGSTLCPISFYDYIDLTDGKKTQYLIVVPAVYSENSFKLTSYANILATSSSNTTSLDYTKVTSKTDVIISGNRATLELWDYQNIDGDIVNVYIDGILQKSNLKLISNKFVLQVSVPNKSSEITIEVVGEGSAPPCTVRVRVVEAGKEFTLEGKKDELMKINLSKAH
ncbi:MAG: hypothetical protein WC059_01995 [Candidatus Paceibacterota bacterium]